MSSGVIGARRLGVLFVVVTVLGSAPAATAGSVRPGPFAGPSLAPSGPAAETVPSAQLTDVACVSADACVSVGSSLRGTTGKTLAERWNGTSWALQQTPNPTGTFPILTGVSCTSTSDCTATGSYVDPSGKEVTLGEHWNGKAWTIQMTPNPPGDSSSAAAALTAVSCVPAHACMAVGTNFDLNTLSESTLAARWNGSSWADATSQASGAQANDVSCVSKGDCIAVGTLDNVGFGSFVGASAERWNGVSWRAVPISRLGDQLGTLDGVSCTSASACTAVGLAGFQGNAPYTTVAERWNGTSWTVQPTPAIGEAQTAGLFDVSCTSATECMAIGGYTNGAGAQRMLSERWNGANWAVQPAPPAPSGAQFPQLSALSCTSASACSAVGYYTDATGVTVTLAERWNGTAWAIQPTP